MCQDLSNKVRTIVTDWVAKGYMFSAFDVTKSLRNMGESVAHWEVRNEVRDQYGTGNLGGHIRTLITVGVSETFIYHPYTSDPFGYDIAWQDNDPTQDKSNGKAVSTNITIASPTSSVAQNIPSTSTRVTYSDGKLHLTKSERRLNIPAHLLYALDIEPGDVVVVDKIFVGNSPKAVLTKAHKNNCLPSGATQVNLHVMGNETRVRLSEKTLIDVFGSKMSDEYNWNFDGVNKQIIVEPA